MNHGDTEGTEEDRVSGLYCTILLKKPFEVNDTGRLTKLLKAIASEVVESRKGRHWDFSVEQCAATLNIEHTSDRSFGYEDTYDQLAITFEDAPDAIEIAFGCRRESDEVVGDKIRNALLAEFDAIDCDIRYQGTLRVLCASVVHYLTLVPSVNSLIPPTSNLLRCRLPTITNFPSSTTRPNLTPVRRGTR